MKYRVVIPREIQDAVDEQVVYLLSEGAPTDRLEGWLTGLYERMESLYSFPRRYAVAEAVSTATGYEVRRMNYGDYAVFYRVDDRRMVVEVIAFRHGRRRPLLEDESNRD